MVVLALLMLGEGAILFLVSSSELDSTLEDNWKAMDDSVREDVIKQFECDGEYESEQAQACIDAAREEAEGVIMLIYYICGGTILLSFSNLLNFDCNCHTQIPDDHVGAHRAVSSRTEPKAA